MGILLEAYCKCGYSKTDLMFGVGFSTEGYKAPAICSSCGDISTQDFNAYMKESVIPTCSICRGSMKFYNDISLRKRITDKIWDKLEDMHDKLLIEKLPSSSARRKKLENIINYLNTPDVGNPSWFPEALYYCPNCKKHLMKFAKSGLWD